MKSKPKSIVLNYVDTDIDGRKIRKQAEVKNITKCKSPSSCRVCDVSKPRCYIAEDFNFPIKYNYRKICRSDYETNPDNYPDYLEIIDRKKRLKIPIEYLGCVYGCGRGKGFCNFHKRNKYIFSSTLIVETVYRNRIRKLETTTNSYQSRIKMIYL